MTYDQVIQSAPTVLVEFYATWCPHCKEMKPIVNQIESLLKGSIDIACFEIGKYRSVAQSIGIESIPTLILYIGGKEVWRHSGEMTADLLLTNIQKYTA